MTVSLETIVFLGLFAAVFTVVPLFRLLRDRSLRRRGVTTHGLVVGHDRQEGVPAGDTRLAPVVEFVTVDGRTIRARSPISSTHPGVPPGRTVTIRYDPADPTEITIVEYGRGALLILLTVGLGIFALDAVLLFGSEETVTRLPALIPVVLGCVFTGIGWYGVGRVWSLRLRGDPADGVVVGETTSSTREGMPLHHPVVRFRLPNGHEIETASERGRTLRRVRQGQSVRVRYHRADPYRVVLAGDGARPVFYVFGVVGLVILVGTATVFAMILRS